MVHKLKQATKESNQLFNCYGCLSKSTLLLKQFWGFAIGSLALCHDCGLFVQNMRAFFSIHVASTPYQPIHSPEWISLGSILTLPNWFWFHPWKSMKSDEVWAQVSGHLSPSLRSRCIQDTACRTAEMKHGGILGRVKMPRKSIPLIEYSTLGYGCWCNIMYRI